MKVWCQHCVWEYQSPNLKRGNYLFKAMAGNKWVWKSWNFCPVCGKKRPDVIIETPFLAKENDEVERLLND